MSNSFHNPLRSIHFLMVYSFFSKSKFQPLHWHSQPWLLLAARGRFLLSLSYFTFNYKSDLEPTSFPTRVMNSVEFGYERTHTNEIYYSLYSLIEGYEI